MADRRHLSVVRDEADEYAAMRQAIQQVASRVPHQLERAYDWTDPAADALFESMVDLIQRGYSATWVEQTVDIPGLHMAYLDWLGRQE